jgi:CRISPR-associated endonuclease/helicase Cas3
VKPDFAAHTPKKGTDDWHTLEDHNAGVLARAKKYATPFGGAEIVELAARWHDLGKFNPGFQNYLERCHVAALTGAPPPDKGVPHAIYGAMLASDLGAEFLCPLIAGHHAGLYAPAELKKRLAEPETRAAFVNVCAAAKRAGLPLELPANLEQSLNFPSTALETEMLLRFAFSALVDADFLDTEAHFNDAQTKLRENPVTVADLCAKLEAHLNAVASSAPENTVNAVRAEVLQACKDAAVLEPGAFKLTVPTGGGKTLSGLMFALSHAQKHGLQRVVIAVPYTSIIEQTVRVYREIFGAEHVLEHHSAAREESLDDSEDPTEAKARAKLAAQNWDAPLVVTTTVQLFESLFGRYTGQCRKLHNLAKSVVVLDEVQTLPLKLLTPITDALKTLTGPRYGASAVFCTATQPALEVQRKFFSGFAPGAIREIVPAPMVNTHFARLERVRYSVNLEPRAWSELGLEWRAQPQLLVVLNTRKDALRALEEWETQKARGDTLEARVHHTLERSSVLHLSTLLCGAHRSLTLQTVRARLKSGAAVQLVSTQVIEAGVDVDFPVVYRALGPLDRIVQAAGRCNREGKMADLGRAFVFVPEGGGAPRGEYGTALAEAKAMLERGVNFNDPHLFETYFTRLYSGVNLDGHGIQRLREALNYPEVEANFNLIGDDTKPVIVEFDATTQRLVDGVRSRGFALRDDYRCLQPYLVNLRTKDLETHATLTSEIAPGMRVWHGGYDALRGIQFGEWASEDLVI